MLTSFLIFLIYIYFWQRYCIAGIHYEQGNYTVALKHYEKSLKIQQVIGDIAGSCYTLFNMGHIFLKDNKIPQALEAWIEVYRVAKAINLAKIFNALENLAGQLGLENGLEYWEKLAQQFKKE